MNLFYKKSKCKKKKKNLVFFLEGGGGGVRGAEYVNFLQGIQI